MGQSQKLWGSTPTAIHTLSGYNALYDNGWLVFYDSDGRQSIR